MTESGVHVDSKAELSFAEDFFPVQSVVLDLYEILPREVERKLKSLRSDCPDSLAWTDFGWEDIKRLV